jgi:hypothetical protein
MGIDKPGEADEPGERAERHEQPDWFTPEQRVEMERLAETGRRWDDLGRYDGSRANLPNPDRVEAARYLEDNLPERPWLEATSHRAVDIQRVVASMDQGSGHQLERHEGFTDDAKLERRVTALEDPAQLDPDKRAAGIDGVTGRGHFCGPTATSIQNPEMFATAFARGVEHPRIREVLDRSELGDRPPAVDVPIEDLLGPEGHVYCSGYRLTPVAGSLEEAAKHRQAWIDARILDKGSELPPPQAEPIESFEGGYIRFVFTPTPDRTSWEVLTMYPNPKAREGNQP